MLRVGVAALFAAGGGGLDTPAVSCGGGDAVGGGERRLWRTRAISSRRPRRQSGISEVYLHQVFSGRRTPSRNRLLCLCFGLGASVEEAQELLRHARLAPLYSRDRRDAIVIFGLSHNMTLGEINDKLYAEDADTLC